jgi:hypothetical protein
MDLIIFWIDPFILSEIPAGRQGLNVKIGDTHELMEPAAVFVGDLVFADRSDEPERIAAMRGYGPEFWD